MREIELKDAEASLSSLIDDAVQGESSTITQNGKRAAVLIGFDEWERLSQVPSFGRLLMSAPISAEDVPPRNRKGRRGRRTNLF